MSKQPLRLLEHVKPGDLISVDWCDASTGKSSMNGGAFDVPAKSWGIYLGIVEIVLVYSFGKSTHYASCTTFLVVFD